MGLFTVYYCFDATSQCFCKNKGMSPVYNCEGRHCSFMNTSMCTLRLNKELFTLCIVLWVKAHFYCTFKILSVYLSRSISVFIIHLFIHLFICIMYVMHIV